MSLGINVFRNKCRRKKSRGNICHLGINIAQSISYHINQSKSQDSNQWINAHQCQLIAIIINRIINLLIMELKFEYYTYQVNYIYITPKGLYFIQVRK